MKKMVVISVVAILLLALTITLLVYNITEKNTDVNNINNLDNVEDDEISNVILDKEEPIRIVDNILIRDPDIKPGSFENDVTANAVELMEAIIKMSKIKIESPRKGTIDSNISKDYLGLSNESFSKYVIDSAFYETDFDEYLDDEFDINLFCILKVNDVSKADDLKREMFENCNPDRWIRSSADRIVILGSGEYILFAMATYDNCELLVSAFKEIFEPAVFGTSYDRTVNSKYINVNN